MCNQFTDIYNNGQQDYTLLANKDVASEPPQTISGGLTSLEILTNMLEDKSLSLVRWKQLNKPDTSNKTLFTTDWK